MAVQVSHAQVYAADIEDRPGGTSQKLRALAEAGADLDFVVSRRTPEKGGGVLYVSPVRGGAVVKAAQQVGFSVAEGLRGLRVEGPDAPGLAAGVTSALAEAGINLRGVSGAAIDGKMVCYVAFDSDADAGKAAEVLTNLE
jgi:hypothetical protein